MLAADLLSTESADRKVCIRCDKSEHITVAEVRKSDAMMERGGTFTQNKRAKSRSWFFFFSSCFGEDII